MKFFKKIFCFLLSFTLLFGTCNYAMAACNDSSSTSPEVTHYNYPIVPGTEEWTKLTTHQAMIDAVQIPQDILDKMTTDELATAVLDNPMIIDIYAYYTLEDGFNKGYDVLCQELNCVRELSKRSNAMSCLTTELNNINSTVTLQKSPEISEELESKYLVGNRILQCITKENSSSIDAIADPQTPKISVLASTTTVSTPKGSSVSVYSNMTWADHGLTANEVTSLSNAYIKAYPNASKIANQSPVYNCHNYAWNTSNPQKYWMNNPSKYMSDGSYSKTATAASGYKVYYPNGGHSATIISNTDDNIYVKSKWGVLPVFKHNVHYSPYEDSGITFWRKNQ